MRTLHFITSLRTGGAERLVTGLTQQMQHSGDEVEVLLMDGTRTSMVDELEKSGIPVHSLGKGPRAMYNPFLLPKLVRFLRKKPFDIVHTHNTPCQILTAFAPARFRITTEHGSQNRRRNWLWFKPVDRWMYGRYKKIVCVGEETRKTLSEWLDRLDLDKRMTIIPNGIDLSIIATAIPSEDLAKREGYKVLMVSAFRPEKDQLTLIRAFQQLPEMYHLFLAGGAETPENQRIFDECKARARDLNVHFLGIRQDVPALLAAADVIVLSSLHEGMSLSVLEGMASGKPLIVSDVDGLRDLVSGAGLLFPQGDAARLAELIREVCENPDFATETALKCQERARKYDIAETARRYREEYLRILACPN